MAITHVVLFHRATLEVLQIWSRSSSDNAAFIQDESQVDLYVDDVLVASNIDTGAYGAFAVDGPTADDVTAPPKTMLVDDATTPTDTAYRTDVGTRDAIYFVDVDSEGLYPDSPP